MTRSLTLLLASIFVSPLFLGCPGDGPPPPPPTDAGTDDEDELPPSIIVSGTVSIHPDAQAYLDANTLAAPALEGLLVRVQEPSLAATSHPDAIYGEVRLDGGATFSVSTVVPETVVLGVGAGILDDQGGDTPRVTRTSTTLYDVALEEGKPRLDIPDAKAFALPVAFTEALEASIGQSAIQTISGQTDLTAAGFILGKIVDAAGAPVSGATVEFITNAQYAENLFYPSADYTSSNQTGTSSTGLFVYVKTGSGSTDIFRFRVKDKSEYLVRNGGAAKEAGLLITVYPGKVAP